MTVKIDGTNTVANPAFTGADTDTGLQCGTNELKLVTGGTARATVDSSGRLLVGASSTFFSTDDKAFLAGDSNSNNGGLVVGRFQNTAGGSPNISLVKSRGASIGTNTIVSSGDEIGRISFRAADGSNYIQGAEIRADVDGTPGSNDMPGRLVFSTCADGASSLTERLRITSDGTIRLASGCPGIDFSQIQTNASGVSSETLDSYEEGTFTPTDASTAGLTLVTAAGLYTKVGKIVHCQIRIKYPTTSSTAHTKIGGFPFTPTLSGSNISNGSNASGVGYFTGNFVPQIHMNNSQAYTNFYNFSTIVTNANFSGKEIRFGVVYTAA